MPWLVRHNGAGKGDFHFGYIQKRTFPKLFLALSRDVDTGSCHRASDKLRRYKSGTGLTSGIPSAAPGIIFVIAALSLIHCQTFGGNDNEQEGCVANSAWRCRCMNKSYSLPQTARITVCGKLFFVFGVFSVQEEFFPFLTASSSVVSDDDMHKLPASRDERADGGHGSESLR